MLPAMRRLAAIFACLALSACGDKPAGSGASSASASAAPAPSASATASAREAVPPPNALDVAGLKKSLRCGGKAAEGPCPILEKFESCKEGWSPITQSGDGRWMGKGHVVKEGKFIDEITLMRSRRVGLADVAPGQLGTKIAIDSLPDDRSADRSASEMAIRALERGDVPKPDNRGVAYVVERSEWSEAFAQQADGHQVYVATGAGAYLCADSATQRLYLVRLAGKQDHPADGLYATLFAVKW
jgi:hypothetical protein